MMPRALRLFACVLVTTMLACGGSKPVAPATSANAKALGEDFRGPKVSHESKLAWNDFDQAVFARAKQERKFVVLDGAAEWCHFCHVMEEMTYGDPRVREVLAKHFIATKVDIDNRPDIEERYGDYGWPATIVFSPDGEELGKYRGYIPPDEFLTMLNQVVSGAARAERSDDAPTRVSKTPLADDALDFTARFTALELEEYWDAKQGGWGREPKVPIGWNALWALSRAKGGDAKLREHALTVLTQQRKIIDPVWGGIYQYSVAPDWDHPHYEKLMFWNAGALASYAEAFALTKDASFKASANDIRRWFDAFMISEGGGFYGTQDADLNSHAATTPHAPTSPRGKGEYMKGEEYYKLGDKERRALGVPRIDPNEYPDDNGLAIYAYVTLARATDDATALATAKRAAERVLSRNKPPGGGLLHVAPPAKDPPPPRVHLSDVALFGFGLTHLAQATNEARWRDEANALADYLVKSLYDGEGGGFFSQPADPNAVGVFKTRRKPFDDNVAALRFLVKLDALLGIAKRAEVVEHSLRAISTPSQIKDRGKFLGDYLSLLDEMGAYRKLPRAALSKRASGLEPF